MSSRDIQFKIGDLVQLKNGELRQVILDSKTLNDSLSKAGLFPHTNAYFITCRPEQFKDCKKLSWREMYLLHERPHDLFMQGAEAADVDSILIGNKLKKHLLRRD